VRRVRRVRVGK